MFKENETIITNKDISSLILKNTKGVIHAIYDNGNYYLVEFVDKFGITINDGLETIRCNDIEKYIDNSHNIL